MKAIYNGSEIQLPAGTTAEAAKSALVQIYPELANATAQVNGDIITFSVQSGTKGSGIAAVYNGSRIELPVGTTPEAAKEALKSIYPELANATVTLRGNEFHFEVRSGTKGSGMAAVYNGSRIELPAGTTAEAAKDALKSIYPELANASVVTRGNEFHFEVRSGTKGN
mgnify:CR=1 FL=1